MKQKSKILFSIPFIINIFVLVFSDYWGFREGKNWILYSNILFLSVTLFLIFFEINNFQSNTISIISSFVKNRFHSWILPLIFGIQLLLFIALPVQNMNYGDGIVLLENVFLESQIFGFQITIDEFWEAFLHSYLFVNLDLQDPRAIYHISSSLAGFVYLGLVLYFLNKQQKLNQTDNILNSILFLTPGGLLLFYGYAENYTLVSLILFTTLLLGRKWIQDSNREQHIISIAILSAIGASFHLVFGYMGLALIYFTWKKSNKGNFVKNAIIASCIGVVYLGILFGYFLFFSDPTTSPGQTHLLSPPLYPWKRWISLNHFKEILGVTWFTSFFPVLIIVFSFSLEKSKTIALLKQPENRFLLLSVLGFYIHGFFHNPSLGFPADWDLFSFYFFPLLILSYYLIPVLSDYKKLLFPLALYAICFQVVVAIHLHANPVEKELEYNNTITLTKKYILSHSGSIEEIHPSKKKLFLMLDVFLFKAENTLRDVQNPKIKNDAKDLLKQTKEFKKSLHEKSFDNTEKYQKVWLKPFLLNLTDYHHKLITIRREEMKYRLEKVNSP